MGRKYAALVAAMVGQSLYAQKTDLTALTLEDFMNLEVTSVEKTREKLSRTPAAVFVITQEDIRRSGASSLPEVLRLAPGVTVARITSSQWAIGIRGFNSLYSNKLLVMIDGRTVYNAAYSGVLWPEDLIMLEDIEQIEVIRGPGATMWGANAVSGVINILTKKATDTTGGLAAISAGTFDRARVRLRYGRNIGKDGAWRAWAQYGLQGGNMAPGLSLPGSQTARGGMRFDVQMSPRDSLLVEGEVQSSDPPAVQGAGGSGPIGALMNLGTTTGYVMGRWNHTTRRGDEMALQAYYNDESINAGAFDARLHTLDFDFQDTVHIGGGHDLIFGGGSRSNVIETRGTAGIGFDPATRTYLIINGFLADEWTIRPEVLKLTAGAKIEDYTMAGAEVQPTVRVMWTPTPRQAYWMSGSRAVRTPAHTDYALRVSVERPGLPIPIQVMGSERFRPEVLKALEAGMRFQVSRSMALDIAAFRHWYEGLYANKLGSPAVAGSSTDGVPQLYIPAITTNGLDGVNQGFEVAGHYDAGRRLQFSGSYSALFASTTYRPGLSARNAFSLGDNTPKHQWQGRVSWDLSRNWASDVLYYWSGALPGGVLPSHSRVDCTVTRKVRESGEFTITGQNLLRPWQREFADRIFLSPALVPRSIEVGFRWNF